MSNLNAQAHFHPEYHFEHDLIANWYRDALAVGVAYVVKSLYWSPEYEPVYNSSEVRSSCAIAGR
jgi:hypothetical protein